MAKRAVKLHWYLSDLKRTACGVRGTPSTHIKSEIETPAGFIVETTTSKPQSVSCARCRRVMRIPGQGR